VLSNRAEDSCTGRIHQELRTFGDPSSDSTTSWWDIFGTGSKNEISWADGHREELDLFDISNTASAS
jgi:hypothetical protein